MNKRISILAKKLDDLGLHHISDEMDRIVVAGYSTELGSLKNYLQDGFNPYDYEYLIEDFASRYGLIDENKEFDSYEWIENASKMQLAAFEEFVNDNVGDQGYDSPAYQSVSYDGMSRPKWQIHFTDDPEYVSEEGFQIGHPEIEGVHLTTYNKSDSPGYNFSFDVNERGTYNKNYGKHAVVFFSGGIETTHYGDEERQNIFWGPNVDPRMIFPIWNDGGDWTIVDSNGREVFTSENIQDCVNWIQTNWTQLYATREKAEQAKRDRKKVQNRSAMNKMADDFWRSPSGYVHDNGMTALDVVKFEAEEHGNQHVLDQALSSGEPLDQIPANEVAWVTKNFEDAERYYGDAKQISTENHKVLVADDGDGGMLIWTPGKTSHS